MADVTITVPQEIVQALRLPPDAVAAELQREPGRGALPTGHPAGKAAALAEMTRWEWEELLGARKIPRHYATRTSTRTSLMPLAVSNSSPLIHLSLVGRIDLLCCA